MEHVIPEDEGYRKIANKFNKHWHKIGKCNINRETHIRIKEANFKIENFEMFGKECFIFVKGIGIKNNK